MKSASTESSISLNRLKIFCFSSTENFEDVDPNLESDCYCLLCRIFHKPFHKQKIPRQKLLENLEINKKDDLKVKIRRDHDQNILNSNQNVDDDDDPLAINSDNLCSICNEVSSNVEKHIVQKHIRQIETIQKGTEKYNMYKCPVCKKYFKKEDLNHSHHDDEEKVRKNNDEEFRSNFEQRMPKDMENNEPEPDVTEPEVCAEDQIEKNNRKRKSELMEDDCAGRPEKIVKPSEIRVNFHAEKNNSSSIKILSPFDNTNINEKKSGGVNIQCSFHGCNLSFKSPDKMKLHLKNAHGIRLFECVSKPKNPIEKSAPVEETLTLDTLEDNINPQHNCNLCYKRFKSKSEIGKKPCLKKYYQFVITY